IIPHFPDDPKARFLDELDADVGQTVNAVSAKIKCTSTRCRGSAWNSIHNLDQFWDLMSFRQECSLGHNVGFMWLVFENTSAPCRISPTCNLSSDLNLRQFSSSQHTQNESGASHSNSY